MSNNVCVHLGERIGEREATAANGTVRVHLYQCGLFNEPCSVRTDVGVRICVGKCLKRKLENRPPGLTVRVWKCPSRPIWYWSATIYGEVLESGQESNKIAAETAAEEAIDGLLR